MTLEDKAEECAKKSFCVAHTHEDELIFKNGYLAGAKESEKENAELKEQIEKMKRCVICRHWHCENNICWLEKEGKCHNKSMWGLD